MIVIRQTANEVVDSKRISELFPFDKEFDHRTKCGNNLPKKVWEAQQTVFEKKQPAV